VGSSGLVQGHSDSMKLLLTAISLSLAVSACSDGHDRLRQDLDQLPVPESVTFLADVEYGLSSGFMGSDPRIDRYYISLEDPEALCAEVQALLPDLTEKAKRGTAKCWFTGQSPSGRPLTVLVTGPQEVIPPGDQTIEPTPIEESHASVLVVAIG
jgi:hypothetical protein